MPANPDHIILGDMADRLNKQFGRHLDEPIASTTPYSWWKRHKKGDLPEPMPTPLWFVGRSPVFRWGDIVRWFIRYKGIGKLTVNVKEVE